MDYDYWDQVGEAMLQDMYKTERADGEDYDSFVESLIDAGILQYGNDGQLYIQI